MGEKRWFPYVHVFLNHRLFRYRLEPPKWGQQSMLQGKNKKIMITPVNLWILFLLWLYELRHKKTCLLVNDQVQHKQSCMLEACLWSENKGADKLCSYCAANLCRWAAPVAERVRSLISALLIIWSPHRCEVGYETQGPSPSFRAESRARIVEFPIFSKLRSGLCFYISPRIK